MTERAISQRTCIVRRTADRKGRSVSVSPDRTAARHLHYGRIMAGVTFSEPGNWTSWPPHEHAAMLEEADLYVEMPPPSFGLQLIYTDEDMPELATFVRQDDVVRITVPGYAASKGGVAQLTRALANEWAGSGINVNAIAPGYMATDNTAALRSDATRSRQILERIPAGRWGTPDDLGGVAVFLGSRASNYFNGHVLVVDGGWMGR